MNGGETPAITTTMYAASLGASPIFDFDKEVEKIMNEGVDLRPRGIAAAVFQPQQQRINLMASTTRLVKVFIADPNESLPLDERLLYKGDEKITDLTDQELFYEIDIKGILEKHNAVRTATVDKATKNRDKPEMLEAARVRDLRMQVIVLAQF